MQCLDPNAPVTGLFGFLYSPESSTDPAFQLPLAFQPTVGSQYESPVGSGTMVEFPQSNFTEPQGAHKIDASAGNQVFGAYSDLTKPLSGMSTLDPKAKTLNAFGMKPVGFYWVPNTPVLEGEICCPPSPVNGNGHTYQAQNSGTTGANPAGPVFPLTEGGTVNDNGITWKEKTMVIANRLPPPNAPTLALAGSGSIATAQDVYIVITLLNSIGETLPSTPVFITTIAGSSSVNVPIPSLASMRQWIQNLPSNYVPVTGRVYVAIVAHGQPAPALQSYGLWGVAGALGAVVNVTTSATTPAPPNFCSARVTPGQLPTPTVEPQIQASPAGAVVAPPGPPVLSLVNGSGSSYVVGVPVNVGLTLVNAAGETTIGPIASINLTTNGQGVKVSLAASYGPSVTGVRVWGCTSQSPATDEGLVSGSPFALGAAPVMTAAYPATALPTENTATLPEGSFVSGLDVYVAQTYTNANGETPLGPANVIVNTNSDDSVLVGPIAVPLGPDNEQLYSITSVGIYEADVPTGTAAPQPSAYALVGYYAVGAYPFITETATGTNPPVTNTTGPGGAIVANTSTGGPNGTQGYRYAAFGWINQIETFSGFTAASVVSTIIDEDGWEIGAFNVPTFLNNPAIQGRYIPFSAADETQDGPFSWIGVVNLSVPSQNVVYPTQTLVNGIQQTSTVFLDNTTTQGTFNFTDDYLDNANNVDDRLDIAIPPIGCRVDYLQSVDRLAVTGVPGLTNGAWISVGDDPESYYADTSPVAVSNSGDICYGVTDQYKGFIFAICASGGFTLSANTGQPDSWAANRRWGGSDPGQQLGPCGYRAWSACGKFIIFAHRSGLYKYDQSDPDMMSKEVPKLWSTINWAYASTICVYIDEDTHTVSVLVPTGASAVPNKRFVLSYIEGWNNPIHFSTFSGKEISMDAARRWSPHSCSAFIATRMQRTIPPGGNQFVDGPTFETLPDSSFNVSQLMFASSNPDGIVNARTPGIFSDNGGYIDWQYEPMSSGLMQAVCKPEGMNLNACGQGILNASFVASRAQADDEGGDQELIAEEDEVFMDPIPLSPKQIYGITRKCGSAVNEFWRPRFRGDRQPGTWVSLKAMTSYMIVVTPGRDGSDK
jgi:hypothetical protein